MALLRRCFGAAQRDDSGPVDAAVADLPFQDTIAPLLSAHGAHPLAWSAMQPGVRVLLLPGVGFVAYAATLQPAWSNVLVLGDPVAPRHR